MINAIAIPESIRCALDRIYSDSVLAGNAKIAKAIGITPRWLRLEGDEGKIVFFKKGSAHRQYAREDVENYLTGKIACQSTKRGTVKGSSNRRTGNTTSQSKSSGAARNAFTAQRARKQKRPQSVMKTA